MTQIRGVTVRSQVGPYRLDWRNIRFRPYVTKTRRGWKWYIESELDERLTEGRARTFRGATRKAVRALRRWDQGFNDR